MGVALHSLTVAGAEFVCLLYLTSSLDSGDRLNPGHKTTTI